MGSDHHYAGGSPHGPSTLRRGRGLVTGLAAPFFVLLGCVSDSERVGMASVDRTLAGAGELQLAAIKRLEEAGLAIVGRFELAGVVIVDRIFDRAERAAEPVGWLRIILELAGAVALAGVSIWITRWIWHRRAVWVARRARSPPV